MEKYAKIDGITLRHLPVHMVSHLTEVELSSVEYTTEVLQGIKKAIKEGHWRSSDTNWLYYLCFFMDKEGLGLYPLPLLLYAPEEELTEHLMYCRMRLEAALANY